MNRYGSRKANANVTKKTPRNMLIMPCCAYCVQISTTRRESASLALVTPSSRIEPLMNSTAR